MPDRGAGETWNHVNAQQGRCPGRIFHLLGRPGADAIFLAVAPKARWQDALVALVNTIGNCASRVTAMMNKYRDGVVPNESTDSGDRRVVGDHDWPALAAAAVAESRTAMEAFDLPGSIAAAMGLVRKVDAFIHATEPFKLAKDESKAAEVDAILYQCLEAVRIASLLLWCVLPSKMEELWSKIGVTVDPAAGTLETLAQWGGLEPGTSTEKVALFPRIDEPLSASV